MPKVGRCSGRQKRFMRDVNHVVSKQIVECVSAGGTIVWENLKGIRRQKSKGRRLNRLLNRWNFHELQSFISYKAEEKGVHTMQVSARNTSKGCSRCGSLDTCRPKKAGFFHCKSCNLSINADFNAARNILARLNPTGNDSRAVVNQPIVSTLDFHC